MTQADPARQRFFVLQLLRLSGVVLAVLGMLVIARRIDLPMVAGYVFLAAGFLDIVVVPLLLARRWRTPRQ